MKRTGNARKTLTLSRQTVRLLRADGLARAMGGGLGPLPASADAGVCTETCRCQHTKE